MGSSRKDAILLYRFKTKNISNVYHAGKSLLLTHIFRLPQISKLIKYWLRLLHISRFSHNLELTHIWGHLKYWGCFTYWGCLTYWGCPTYWNCLAYRGCLTIIFYYTKLGTLMALILKFISGNIYETKMHESPPSWFLPFVEIVLHS